MYLDLTGPSPVLPVAAPFQPREQQAIIGAQTSPWLKGRVVQNLVSVELPSFETQEQSWDMLGMLKALPPASSGAGGENDEIGSMTSITRSLLLLSLDLWCIPEIRTPVYCSGLFQRPKTKRVPNRTLLIGQL